MRKIRERESKPRSRKSTQTPQLAAAAEFVGGENEFASVWAQREKRGVRLFERQKVILRRHHRHDDVLCLCCFRFLEFFFKTRCFWAATTKVFISKLVRIFFFNFFYFYFLTENREVRLHFKTSMHYMSATLHFKGA